MQSLGVQTVTGLIAETTAATDAFTAATTALASIAESTAAADTIAGAASVSASISESTAITDAEASTEPVPASASETCQLQDLFSASGMVPNLGYGGLLRRRKLTIAELEEIERRYAEWDADIHDLVENRGFPDEVLLLLMLH